MAERNVLLMNVKHPFLVVSTFNQNLWNKLLSGSYININLLSQNFNFILKSLSWENVHFVN